MEYYFLHIQQMNKYKNKKKEAKVLGIEQMTRGSDFLRGCLASVK